MQLHPHPVAVGLRWVYCHRRGFYVPCALKRLGQHFLLKLQLPAVAYVLQRAAAAPAEEPAGRKYSIRGRVDNAHDSPHQVTFLRFCYLYLHLFPRDSIGNKHSHAVHMGQAAAVGEQLLKAHCIGLR